ncbi:MAG: bacillithiol biosynthesis deacetylase BshB1 [Bacteroidetes bacterium]|nr:MAG: bacillithiol biosynthesis deacetylase BshB1 [Bacteroidota bacterium]REK08062.1 MAG: bacillithiol biosynthesis deacetylase BshB1 [Bacteroidota bacterium]REK32267.1 MAG: bacillithiol biosynthesis deacetylase BshB1 [Bacteroidota bacterium]REK47419.1 MAG: bacillithiol biosynthesis deacetylase BshB1 [Bacteroidota bacterium]
MKLDILAFGAHPDDVELSCSGTLIKHMKMGMKVGVADLTKGELGTRGNALIRLKEAETASKILGLSVRVNLELADGLFETGTEEKVKIIRVIRQFRPRIVMCNAVSDRHPDHGRAGKLVADACFLSGLSKFETSDQEGKPQAAWRPSLILHYIQDRYLKPGFVIDITDVWDEKMKSIMAFESQFFNPESKEPDTPISSEFFLDFIRNRAIEFGRHAGVPYAEGFITESHIKVNSLDNLL